MNNLPPVYKELQLKQIIITSLIAGFFLLPIHELGHVICDWLTGNPAGMSYARDYLLGNSKETFLGELGGPLLPILMSTVAVLLIYKGKINLSVIYPFAVLGCMDRLTLYIIGILPSDERYLAGYMHWNMYAFRNIFLSCEIILLFFIIYSLFRFHVRLKMKILCLLIPIISFIILAAFGVLIVEKYIFPTQFHLQFG
ncbi:MAG: hypothetical protein ABR980_07150 [Ignavibacteriaceae bacterium]|jgi:hypothetical protein